MRTIEAIEKSYFKSIGGENIEKLSNISIIKQIKKDDIIFYQGDNSYYLHHLIEGVVNIYKSNPNGGEIFLHQIRGSSLIAEAANFEDIPYPATAIAYTDVIMLKIDYKKFYTDFLRNPDISFAIIKSLSTKIRYISSFIDEFTIDAKTKILNFIDDNNNIINSLKHYEIAQILNITPETLSRTLVKLKKDGLLSSTNPIIRVKK
jgi:CRP/FNR family transcriptional regulator